MQHTKTNITCGKIERIQRATSECTRYNSINPNEILYFSINATLMNSFDVLLQFQEIAAMRNI